MLKLVTNGTFVIGVFAATKKVFGRSGNPALILNLMNGSFNSSRGKLSILREFWDFLRVRKKWWLAPIVIMLLLLGLILVLSEGSAVAPFIYTLF